jgi:hypothetical protein
VVAVAVAAFVLRGAIFRGTPKPPALAQADAGGRATPPELPPTPPPPEKTVPPTPQADALAAKLAEVDNLCEDERWDPAIKLCDEILAKDPSLRQAQEKKERAQTEKRSQEAHTRLSETNDADRAFEAYRKIPEDSRYQKRASTVWAKIRPAFIEKHLKSAKAALAESRCADVKREIGQVILADEHNAAAIALRDGQKCKTTVVLAPVTKIPKPPKEHVERPEPAAQLDDDKARALLDEAAAASTKGQIPKSMELAMQATKLTKKPGLLNRANSTLANGYCTQGKKAQAQRLLGRLDASWRNMVRQSCHSKGVDLD